MIRTIIFTITAISLISCKKETSIEDAPKDNQQAAALTAFLESRKLHLTKYYSETPIDYIDTDQVVKAETDLWQYVSPWLRDDDYIFGEDGTFIIEQNTIKIPGNNAQSLTKRYYVETDKSGNVNFHFVGYEYQDLTYHLITFNDSMLKVSATWNGNTVISEYETIQQ
jgi:hypothetical protein